VADKPHHLGHRQRLKEKFLAEPKALADYELLEMLLFAASPRKDVKPMAKKLINKFGSFAKVCAASVSDLKTIDGLGITGIATIKAVQESASRMLITEAKEKTVISNWAKLIEYLRIEMGHLKEEQFRALFLNSKNMLLLDEVQNEGTINHTMAYPREIVKRALEVGAASIILAHNHPSGDLTPSRSDIDLTQQIVNAAKPLGISIHDHVIISQDCHYSFKSKGLI